MHRKVATNKQGIPYTTDCNKVIIILVFIDEILYINLVPKDLASPTSVKRLKLVINVKIC